MTDMEGNMNVGLRDETLRSWVLEDLGYGDVTSEALIPPTLLATAKLFYKEPGVAAGLEEAVAMFSLLGCTTTLKAKDGDSVKAGQILLTIKGSGRSVLSGERVALNVVAHMAGIATATAEAVRSARSVNPGIRVAATRKTLPGLRYIEKRAVELGGGDSHRLGLDDMVLIKDNHIKLQPSIREAIRLAREKISFTKKIEAEARTGDEAEEAAAAGADIVLLDNMPPREIDQCLRRLEARGLREGRLIEVSGGITLRNVAEYAATGVDVVSLGSLTHSSRALDVKLEVELIEGSRA